MKQTKTAFQWDSVTHIFTPEITSNPQLRLQKLELIESDIRGELKRYSGKSDALPQGQPGYRNHKIPEYLIVNVPISASVQKTDISRSNCPKDELYAECV